MAIIKVITPSVTDANITTAKVTDNAITLAKMASGTDGNIISYDASGNPVAIATGSDGQVLTSTGAGSPPAFEAAAAGGKVLQVVQAVVTAAFSTTSASLTDITGMTAAITPSSTSSKILITSIIPSHNNGSAVGYPRFVLLRNSTQISLGASVGSATQDSAANNVESSFSGGLMNTVSNYLDSPNTTDAITYKWQTSVTSSRTQYFFVPSQTGDSNAHTAPGTIILMEIGA